MIYKGIMGEQEVSLLFNTFDKIFRFASRGAQLTQINTIEQLAEVDIEAEVYNEILKYKVNDITDSEENRDEKLKNSILVISSNSSQSIVTDFVVFESVSIYKTLVEKLKGSDFSRLIQSNAIFVVNKARQHISNINATEKLPGSKIMAIAGRSRFDSIVSSETTIEVIKSKLSSGGHVGFATDTFESLNRPLRRWNRMKDAGLNPIMFIEINVFRMQTYLLIDTGYTKNELADTFSFNSGDEWVQGVDAIRLTPNLIFRESGKIEVPDFDKLVDIDAQPFLLKKVKGYINRRTTKPEVNPLVFTELKTVIGGNIDKNFFKPSSRILNNMYVNLAYDSGTVREIKESLDELKKVNLLSNVRIEKKLGEAIKKSIEQYQEIWGSYKPLSKKFFTDKNENMVRVRELFYNVLYAYVDRALGGYMSTSGKRKYTPKISQVEKMLKEFPPITEEEKKLIQYINRSNNPFESDKIEDQYLKFIKDFMKEKADDVYSMDNYSINFIPKDNFKDINAIFRKTGFSLPKENVDLYMVSVMGVESSGIDDTMRYLQFNYNLGGKEAIGYISRNLYQFFIFINIKNQDITVIRPSLVDDATQFSINFQDWDIRMDLTNLINNLISKPKDLLIGDKERVGLSKPANPSEKSLYFLSEPTLREKGVLDHPLTLHHDPLRFNRVTRQKSGHLFFENTEGILVIFPFDTFYHDMEGQGERSIDVCFTSVPHIYDEMLLRLIQKNLSEQFVRWVLENKDTIVNHLYDRNTPAQLEPFINVLTLKTTPILTIQVFKGIFIKSIKERLEGHIFRNSPNARAACVFVPPYEQGFFSAGDVGMFVGGRGAGNSQFPFDWRSLGGNSVSALETNFDYDIKRRIIRLWKDKLNATVDGVINLKNQYLEELSVTINQRGFNFINFVYALYNVYVSLAVDSSKSSQNKTKDLEELVREEIKIYLKKNPEAIQMQNIARRNMSRQ